MVGPRHKKKSTWEEATAAALNRFRINSGLTQTHSAIETKVTSSTPTTHPAVLVEVRGVSTADVRFAGPAQRFDGGGIELVALSLQSDHECGGIDDDDVVSVAVVVAVAG